MRNLNAEVLRAMRSRLSIASIEGLGILLLWWIADRACRIRAIFIELR